jgi:hypothetical protein
MGLPRGCWAWNMTVRRHDVLAGVGAAAMRFLTFPAQGMDSGGNRAAPAAHESSYRSAASPKPACKRESRVARVRGMVFNG